MKKPLLKKKHLLSESSRKYCSSSALQLVNVNLSSQMIYQDISATINNLDFIDHFVLWSLLQMTIRPDQASISSRLQVLMNYEGEHFYFDFSSLEKTNQAPYLYGIQWILKKFKKNKRLEEYASLLSTSLSKNLKKLKIDSDFGIFLTDHFEKIKKNTLFSSYYLRGTDILRENESPPILDYEKMISHYRSIENKQQIQLNTNLTKFYSQQGFIAQCNYDLNLYKHSIFIIEKEVPGSHIFGLSWKDKRDKQPKEKNRSTFFATSSQVINEIRSFNKHPLFLGSSRVRPPALCYIENHHKNIWLLSNQSRDSGQHLFHLMKYGIQYANTFQDVSRLIDHSRHLFLSNPVRLVFESQRSSKKQIENLLKLDIPLYNAPQLGNIWSFSQFNDKASFITDQRNKGHLTCP